MNDEASSETQTDRFAGDGPPYGPPDDPMEQTPPTCRGCGSFMRWICKHEEIKADIEEAKENGENPAEVAPPGPWGYWECQNCDGGEAS